METSIEVATDYMSDIIQQCCNGRIDKNLEFLEKKNVEIYEIYRKGRTLELQQLKIF